MSFNSYPQKLSNSQEHLLFQNSSKKAMYEILKKFRRLWLLVYEMVIVCLTSLA